MKLKYLIISSFLFLTGCDMLDYNYNSRLTNDSNSSLVEKSGDSGQLTNPSDKILIIDNDAYDPDYIPLVLSSIHENKNRLINIGLMIVSEKGVSNKTNMLYRSILEQFDSKIDLTISHNSSDRVFKSKLTNNLENYVDIIRDDEIEEAAMVLQTKLEAQDDKTVSYATGGKLIFLSKFLSDPYRLELFKLKVKDITFGLGCNVLDKSCSKDFNLAATDKAYSATKDIYNKLHNKIPFIVVNDRRGDIKKIRSLDIFKSANIPLMKHLLGTNIYGTYGDHHAGDIEILLSHSRADAFEKHKCNVALVNKSFKAQGIDKAGNDTILINKKIDINGITKAMYQSLISNKE